VGQPQHSPAVAGELDHHAFTDVAEAVELVLGQQAHVLRGLDGGHGEPPAGIVTPCRRLTTPVSRV
jgi:hypothetical protein